MVRGSHSISTHGIFSKAASRQASETSSTWYGMAWHGIAWADGQRGRGWRPRERGRGRRPMQSAELGGGHWHSSRQPARWATCDAGRDRGRFASVASLSPSARHVWRRVGAGRNGAPGSGSGNFPAGRRLAGQRRGANQRHAIACSGTTANKIRYSDRRLPASRAETSALVPWRPCRRRRAVVRPCVQTAAAVVVVVDSVCLTLCPSPSSPSPSPPAGARRGEPAGASRRAPWE